MSKNKRPEISWPNIRSLFATLGMLKDKRIKELEKELEEMTTSAKKNLLRALTLRNFLEEHCAYVEKYDPETGKQSIISITGPEGFEMHMKNTQNKDKREQI